MKVSEFEERLTTVSDSKLMQMLSASRLEGPAVAVKLIVAEGGRRGLKGLDVEAPALALEELDDLMPKVESADGSSEEENSQLDNSMDSSKWLNEESSNGKIPVMIKVLLFAACIAVLIFGALKVFHLG